MREQQVWWVMVCRDLRWRHREGGRWRRGVVQVDVEEKLVLLIGIALVESARDSAIGGADVAVHDIAEHSVRVGNFRKLFS